MYVKQDLTVDDIRTTAREFAAKHHNQFDAFVFFILAHGGSNDVIYGVNGGTISVSELKCFFNPVECPTLQNKPKLFFFQPCLGLKNIAFINTHLDIILNNAMVNEVYLAVRLL